MTPPQINARSEVEAAALMSVSHSKIIFLRGANTEMKTNGAISGNSGTGQKIFMARQWTAMIGFCGIETWKQV